MLEASVPLTEKTAVGRAHRQAAGLRLSPDARYLLAVVGVVNLGLFVRLLHVASGNGFPLNDGGMFFAMIEDVKRADFALPAYTSYNGGDIPFAYPPFGFYLGAILSKAFGWSTLDLLRFLPLAASVATIGAFHILARRLVHDRSTALLATLLFALAPRAFNWEIVGGGMTRSFGLLFAVLAVAEGLELIRHGGRRRLATTTLLCALTLLTHLEMAMFAGYSLALLYVATSPRRTTLLHGLAVASGTLILTAPWWAQVLEMHGFAPFLSAARSGNHTLAGWLSLPLYDFTEEPLFPLIGALGLLGVAYSIGTRQYFLPVWLAVIFALDPRKAPTFATLPLAMLAATAVPRVVLPLLRPSSAAKQADGRPPMARYATFAAAAFALVYLTSSALIADRRDEALLYAIPAQTRDAMSWIRVNTQPDARFVVVTGIEKWGRDGVSEWFPELTGRTSLVTVQGAEWLGAEQFDRRQADYAALQKCATGDAGCLIDWSATRGRDFSYAFLPALTDSAGAEPKLCCSALRAALLSFPGSVALYDGPGGSVLGLKPPSPTSPAR